MAFQVDFVPIPPSLRSLKASLENLSNESAFLGKRRKMTSRNQKKMMKNQSYKKKMTKRKMRTTMMMRKTKKMKKVIFSFSFGYSGVKWSAYTGRKDSQVGLQYVRLLFWLLIVEVRV